MGADDDIAAQLPEPPPPAPLPRQRAIDEALRRFDAVQSGQPLGEAAPARAPWFARIGRPQAAALVTAGLVALFGVPAAWLSVSHRSAPAGQEQLASAGKGAILADHAAPPPLATPSAGGPQPATAPPPAMVAPPAIVAEPVVAPPMPAEPQQEMARQSANEARLASAAAPAQPMRTDALTSAEAEGRMAPAKPGYGSASRDGVEFADTAPPPRPAAVLAPPPPPPAMVVASKSAAFAPSDIPVTAQRAAKAKDAGDLVVTGQHRAERLENLPASIAAGKRRKSTLSGAGDWNACTINDPGRNLRSCRRLLDPAAPGPKGQAAARVADGLSRAWQGDLDGAIAAFDKAIATAPNDAIAYLNRGLALQRKGEFSRANADLDRAVRYAPGAARGYFNRGQLLRQRGEADRATADEDRAVALDPGYEAVVQ